MCRVCVWLHTSRIFPNGGWLHITAATETCSDLPERPWTRSAAEEWSGRAARRSPDSSRSCSAHRPCPAHSTETQADYSGIFFNISILSGFDNIIIIYFINTKYFISIKYSWNIKKMITIVHKNGMNNYRGLIFLTPTVTRHCWCVVSLCSWKTARHLPPPSQPGRSCQQYICT